MAKFLQVLCAEGAVDDAVIAAHRDRHAMADDDLVAIIEYWHFRDPADCKNETLRRIDDGGKTVDPHAAEIRDGKCAALKFFRLHSLVARAVSQILREFADFAERFVLRGANHRRQQSIFNRDGDAKIDIRILEDRVAIKRRIYSWHLDC